MATLKDDLASLRIDAHARAGEQRSRSWIYIVLVLLLFGGAGGWFWSQRMQATPVKTAAVSVRAPGPAVGGRGAQRLRLRHRAAPRDRLVEGHRQGDRGERRGRHGGQEGPGARAPRRLAARAPRWRWREAQLVGAQQGAAENEVRLQAGGAHARARRQQLLKEGVVGKAELDDAQAEVDSLKARIASAQQQMQRRRERRSTLQQTDLDDTVIRAPFSGVAISKDAQPGEMISPVSAGGGFTRTGICTIVDMRRSRSRWTSTRATSTACTRPAAGRGGARRVSGLADSGARHHDDADGRSAEGDGAGAHRLRRSSTRASCRTWASR